MKKIAPSNWTPSAGLKLEENAWNAITAPGNTLVVAGPGSGKTELLAQKASYLLQTNTCPYSRKILAISFKRDAACNLKDRVLKRCGEKLSRRFDSLTFDAFAKSLLDRFRNGLPAPYQLSGNYELMADAKIAKDEIRLAFRSVNEWYYYNTGIKFEEYITSMPLPHDTTDADIRIAQAAWLNLTQRRISKVDFKMIMRLAQYIMVTNPLLRSYLHQTYSHVFLDEFQDTTYLQYDFLNTCFAGSSVNYTAVGDDKQTIMGWAGAIPKIFERYKADVGADRLPLKTNFRSAPRLVRLQNYLVKELLGKNDFAMPSPNWKGEQGEAKMCFFKDQGKETDYLATQIKDWIQKKQLPPREICILVKQRLPDYTTVLIEKLMAMGIRARDETILQDLLTEEAALYVINFLIVVFSNRYDKESDDAFSFLCDINPGFDDRSLLSLKKQYLAHCRKLRDSYDDKEITDENIKEMIVSIIKFASIEKIKNTFIQYQQGIWLNKMMKNLLAKLTEYIHHTRNMVAALDALRGKDTIPVMTTHKSKGLEYHTVIFVGLEDSAFWSYNTQAESDNNLVFVALSRAKERVLFTFCANRGRDQTADDIAIIHRLLTASPDVEVLDL